jgi:methylated-DNA-[protein]-cysteine S-methyltransferase
VAVTHVRYAVPAWGVGELVVDGDRLLLHELPSPGSAHSARGSHELAGRFARYFGGEPVSFDDVELELDGATEFARALTVALRGVPRGEVVTYGELAALAGRPGAHRAAGTFCAQNAFGLVVTCHRVVAAGGLGGYGSLGASYKRRLLALEGVRVAG